MERTTYILSVIQGNIYIYKSIKFHHYQNGVITLPLSKVSYFYCTEDLFVFYVFIVL